jgi:hypothetical protein
LAGFQVIMYGRFWVFTEATNSIGSARHEALICSAPGLIYAGTTDRMLFVIGALAGNVRKGSGLCAASAEAG